jgi:pimeloyl-ACP methyl ester carboxylesterase
MPSPTRVAELPQYGASPRSLRAAIAGATLHLLEWGDPEGRPILMVHGMRGHARWFTPVGPALAEGYRALSLDLRGHGESSHSPPYGPLTYADDVVALVDALKLDGLILIGHSMGGGVALRAADRLGERLAALVLVDSNLRGGPPPDVERAWRERAERTERGPRELSVFGTWEQARARFALRPGGTVASSELLDHLAHHALRELPEGGFAWRFDPNMQGFQRQPRPEPPDPARIRCPVGLIFGAESPIRQRIDLEALRGEFSGARFAELEIIDGAHHHVFLDRPAEFNRSLLAFLSRV